MFLEDTIIIITSKVDGDMRSIENVKNLSRKYGMKPVWMKQTHGNDVKIVDQEGEVLSDGVFTGREGLMLVVRAADCVPVAFIGKRYVGVIHAGWKGLKSGIIDSAVEIFKKTGEKVGYSRIVIGPHICENCYEVGKEFLRIFDSSYISLDMKFNMKKCIMDILKREGFRRFIVFNECTFENKEYFSYRRGDTGRNSMIVGKIRKGGVPQKGGRTWLGRKYW